MEPPDYETQNQADALPDQEEIVVEGLRCEIERLQSQLDIAVVLLGEVDCPNCDGSGAYYDRQGDVCQCQWCHELSQIKGG